MMQNLFFGMLFVFLDFNLELGEVTIGLIPNFVGYILLVRGLEELYGESTLFQKALPISKGMVVFSVVMYVINLMVLNVQLRFAGWLLGLALTITNLLISRWIVSGVQEMERKKHVDLGGAYLDMIWKALAAVVLVAYAISWIPLIGGMCAIASFVIAICYLAAFHHTKQRYLESNNQA